QMTREKQRFIQYLSYKCITFTKDVELFLIGKSMMDLFLASYSLEELLQMSLDDLADYLLVKVRNRLLDLENLAKSIQRVVRTSYRLDKVVEYSIDTIIGTSITLIRAFEKQIKELDKSIKRIMKGVPQTLQTIPGMGPVFTAGIISEIGQIDRFKDESDRKSVV